MSAEVQQIVSAVRALNPEQREELEAALKREARALPIQSRAELVRSIRGKYARVPTSSEAFIARKREEIALEE
jgi:hypothetical protein